MSQKDGKRSLARAMGDRIFELRNGSGCAADAFFHRLHTLEGTAVESDHDYLVSAIESAMKEFNVHVGYARQIIAHIKNEKRRVAAEAARQAHEHAFPCIGMDGRRHAAYVRPGVTITD